jgi:hypothetical protein
MGGSCGGGGGGGGAGADSGLGGSGGTVAVDAEGAGGGADTDEVAALVGAAATWTGCWWVDVEGVDGMGTNSPGRHVWGWRRMEGSFKNRSA